MFTKGYTPHNKGKGKYLNFSEQICHCGCKQMIIKTKNNKYRDIKYIVGHNRRSKNYFIPRFCKCGCGNKLTCQEPWRTDMCGYILGHHRIGKKWTDETKKKQREAAIKYIETTKLYGLPLCPRIGKQEKPILDELEKQYNYPIIRQHYIDGYWLDGYCKELNIAIEIDEPYHTRTKFKEHDIKKEEYVKNKLNCEFIRIPIGG